MGITLANKELSASSISCGGCFNVKLTLTAEPSIQSNPTDIVLILDRSGSMAGSPLANLKNGARKFIDIIDESTDGSQNGQIGSGSRIGIVSFADSATQDALLMTSVTQLRGAVDALIAGGTTNHADAFTKALQLFNPLSTNARVMVMFTDGKTTAGIDPSSIAAAARAQGVTIYAIGLSGNGGIDEDALEDWASDPSSAYVAITPDDSELEELFENLARNISKPGATNIAITDRIASCFRVTSLTSPSKGTASLVNSNTIRWNISQLGVTQSEAATLEFTVQHVGDCSGMIEVNSDIEYSDSEGNSVIFPSPEIDVDCGVNMIAEDCPEPSELTVEGCGDSVEFDADDITMQSLGCIVQLTVRLRNVCPNRRVALAAILSELDDQGGEHKRGLKTMTVPAHTRSACQDVTIRCIKFVLPEDLDVSGSSNGVCNARTFRARFIAHYIDHDFDCCDLT